MQATAQKIRLGAEDSPPPDVAATLLARARTLVGSNRADAARPLLAAVRRLGGDVDEADGLEARLLTQAGRLADALAVLDPAIERAPAHASLRLIRAETRLMAGDPQGAAQDAAEAVIAEPDNARAKATLGITLADLRFFGQAIACLAEALRASPAHPGFRVALARAQDCAGDAHAAAATLHDGIALAPGSLLLRNAAVQHALATGDCTQAVALAETARRQGVLDASLFDLMGQALAGLGRHEAAGEAYAEALKLAPEDAYLRHMVAASGLLPAPPLAADGFIRTLFDRQAAGYDRWAVSSHYGVPGLMAAAAQTHAGLPATGRVGPVLDLGCGTGLVAAAMADLPLGPWHGVDLSPAMLRQALAKGAYEQLHQASLLDALAQEGPDYALATAADVFCWFGALPPLLVAVHRRLLPGGLLIASVEALPAGLGWQLGHLGRYAHALDYLASAAADAGLAVVSLTPATLRVEAEMPIEGLVAVLRKPAA